MKKKIKANSVPLLCKSEYIPYFHRKPPNTFWSISYILINIPLPEFLKSDPCSKDILIALSVHTTICCATFYSMKELSVDKSHENSDIAIKGGNMDQIAL